jgi:hypothetical protein
VARFLSTSGGGCSFNKVAARGLALVVVVVVAGMEVASVVVVVVVVLAMLGAFVLAVLPAGPPTLLPLTELSPLTFLSSPVPF